MKTTYSVLAEMEDNGLLTDAVKKELVPVTLIFHKQVYELYLMYCKHEKTKSGAVMSAAVEAQISERSVWYIVKKMES
jgi:hypothetical protein